MKRRRRPTSFEWCVVAGDATIADAEIREPILDSPVADRLTCTETATVAIALTPEPARAGAIFRHLGSRTRSLALAVLVAGGPSLAPDAFAGSDIRDANGLIVGTVTPGIGDRVYIRDRSGLIVGSVTPGIGDRLTIRDRSGLIVGSFEGTAPAKLLSVPPD